MHGILAHGSGDSDMVPLMALESVLIIHGHNLRIAIGHDHHLLARGHAFLGARLAASVGALGAAFRVSYPAVDGGGLPHIVERQSRQGEYKTDRKTNH